MSEITLEKIDILRERTGVTYTEAKEALDFCEGNVVDALIFIEKNEKCTMDGIYTSKDEFINWIKEAVKRGNVTRIKIKKEDKIVVDLPVNAGIMAGLVAFIWPPLIAIGVLTAVFTKVTVEITKSDGTVEIVNKIIKTTVDDVKEKVSDMTSEVKDKVSDITSEMKDKFNRKDNESSKDSENVYKYTVRFEDVEEKDK